MQSVQNIENEETTSEKKERFFTMGSIDSFRNNYVNT